MYNSTRKDNNNFYFVDIKTLLNRLLVGVSFSLRRKRIVLQKEITNTFVKLDVKPKQLELLLSSKLQTFIGQLAESSLLKLHCSIQEDTLSLDIYSDWVVDSELMLDGLMADIGGKLEILSIPDWGTELLISIPCQTLNSPHETAL